MSAKKTLKMQCDVCGTEIVVSTSGVFRLEPILCCGLEVVEVPLLARKEARKKARSRKTASPKKPVSRAGTGKKTSKTPAKKRPVKSISVGKTVRKNTAKKTAAKKQTVKKPVARANRKR